jgi:1-acyl-sn-glycerol-3-phosphate acyltransferase
MLRWISKTILNVLGWKVEGDPSNEINKKLYIVVPHTSNMDFFLGMLVKWAKGIKVNFLGKKSLFFPPLGWFLTYLGIVPVKKNGNQIDEIISIYQSRDKVAFGLAPEGTRSRVEQFKSGFYHIAHGAQVPVIMVTFDFGKKIVHFRKPYYVSDDKEKDMAFVQDYYEGVVGYHGKDSYRT